MEEATEAFGEAFTYRDPFGATCTLEQIWIQLQSVFGLYTQQIALNREIMDQLVARNQHQQNPAFVASSSSSKDGLAAAAAAGAAAATEVGAKVTVPSASSVALSQGMKEAEEGEESSDTDDANGGAVGILAPMPRDKDQGMILLSAWLNQPHLKVDALATFDEFCQVEMFET